MKQGLGWLGDPSLHLIALSTVLLGAVLALNSGSWGRFAARAVEHPPGCHACSVCPPDVVAARDAYLIRTGSIQPPDFAE
jgi:hypothetical protein